MKGTSRLSPRAGPGFHLATMSMTVGYFDKNQKKKRT